jgi:hypothetical protein
MVIPSEKMTKEQSLWELASPIAALQCGEVRGRVDVAHPQLGVRELQLGSRPISGDIMALDGAVRGVSTRPQTFDWPATIADVYVRENDLVASYQPTERWPFAPQVYWSSAQLVLPESQLSVSHMPLARAYSVFLLVSVQTDLLDTHPEIRVTTRLPAVEVMELRHDAESQAQALLWRLVESNWSYLEFVPRSDYGELAIGGDASGKMTCEWRLFGDFLEKGVIRRARVSAAFLPRERDESVAAECCRYFANRPLPLTT